jgi:hypothetical protein
MEIASGKGCTEDKNKHFIFFFFFFFFFFFCLWGWRNSAECTGAYRGLLC